jgi:hypothetical protein
MDTHCHLNATQETCVNIQTTGVSAPSKRQTAPRSTCSHLVTSREDEMEEIRSVLYLKNCAHHAKMKCKKSDLSFTWRTEHITRKRNGRNQICLYLKKWDARNQICRLPEELSTSCEDEMEEIRSALCLKNWAHQAKMELKKSDLPFAWRTERITRRWNGRNQICPLPKNWAHHAKMKWKKSDLPFAWRTEHITRRWNGRNQICPLPEELSASREDEMEEITSALCLKNWAHHAKMKLKKSDLPFTWRTELTRKGKVKVDVFFLCAIGLTPAENSNSLSYFAARDR